MTLKSRICERWMTINRWRPINFIQWSIGGQTRCYSFEAFLLLLLWRARSPTNAPPWRWHTSSHNCPLSLSLFLFLKINHQITIFFFFVKDVFRFFFCFFERQKVNKNKNSVDRDKNWDRFNANKLPFLHFPSCSNSFYTLLLFLLTTLQAKVFFFFFQI